VRKRAGIVQAVPPIKLRRMKIPPHPGLSVRHADKIKVRRLVPAD
jgi:hypothetical protein